MARVAPLRETAKVIHDDLVYRSLRHFNLEELVGRHPHVHAPIVWTYLFGGSSPMVVGQHIQSVHRNGHAAPAAIPHLLHDFLAHLLSKNRKAGDRLYFFADTAAETIGSLQSLRWRGRFDSHLDSLGALLEMTWRDFAGHRAQINQTARR